MIIPQNTLRLCGLVGILPCRAGDPRLEADEQVSRVIGIIRKRTRHLGRVRPILPNAPPHHTMGNHRPSCTDRCKHPQ